MTIDEAQDFIKAGVTFGDVFPLVDPVHHGALREWFVRTPGLPCLAARTPTAAGTAPSGNACPRCGGLMVRTGSCETCQACGESSGGCG